MSIGLITTITTTAAARLTMRLCTHVHIYTLTHIIIEKSILDILVIMSYLQTQTCTEDKREFVWDMEREGGGEVGRIRELASVCVIFCVQ
jgi:hypothetical protein